MLQAPRRAARSEPGAVGVSRRPRVRNSSGTPADGYGAWLGRSLHGVDRQDRGSYGESYPAPGFNYTRRQPYGVVGVIVPWNGPLMATCTMAAVRGGVIAAREISLRHASWQLRADGQSKGRLDLSDFARSLCWCPCDDMGRQKGQFVFTLRIVLLPHVSSRLSGYGCLVLSFFIWNVVQKCMFCADRRQARIHPM